MKLIKDTLRKINKPFVKSIKSPDGDIIDCVMIHLQPAFDHPMLKAVRPLDPPEIPNGNKDGGLESEVKQLWSSNSESCPHGTIPIRRTTDGDILRSNSISEFGMKFSKTDSSYNGHEAKIHQNLIYTVYGEDKHAIAFVRDGEFYGAKATLNVWAPNVTRVGEFSLSQIWVISNPSKNMSTFEAGWQVSPTMYNNGHLPRFFTYWTNDGYRSGCYNLICSGFIQTTPKFCLGATIGPISKYNGGQFVITVLIWQDPRHGNWWLKVGSTIVGYWPVALFPDLKEHATVIEYGGEVYNAQTEGPHTSTKMGSGHFPSEGYGKAAYIRNMEFVDQDNNLNPIQTVELLAEKENCYNVRNGFDSNWGNYIFFGGPGNNPNCP
ncbi:hypothetical protein L1887_15085 [Cichorium endivia]|nr:hypothetical protein L1887_15085 [Cichorium endivia]